MEKITIVIQVFNEQENIIDCVKSALLLSKNVVVMNMQSTDQTVAKAKQAGAKIINIPYSSYVEPVRKYAFSKINSDWIFILDADERITKELTEEIEGLIAKSAQCDEKEDEEYKDKSGYEIPD